MSSQWRWITQTLEILARRRRIANSELARILLVDAHKLEKALWDSTHPNLDFCPTRSSTGDLVWEWRFPEEQ